MPVDPADMDGSGDEVARHWSVFELAVLSWLAVELRKGTPAHVVRRRLLRETGTAGAEGARLAANAVDKAWRAGERSARRDIAQIERVAGGPAPVAAPHVMAPPTVIDTPAPPALGPVQGPHVTPADVARTGQPDRRVVPAARRAVEQATAVLAEGMERAAYETAVRTAGRYEAIVREVAKAQLAGESNALQVQQRALNEWARKGLPAFTDRAGRTWSNQAYSEMLTRTVTQRAYRDAAHATLVAEGYDLVIVSSHRNPAPMCQPYERKVLSLSGRTRGIVQIPSALTGDMVTVEVTASMAEAEAQGYHHPNCFAADTLVTSPSGIKAADRRWYEGKMVTVHTAGGQKLAGTPNHPVLTPEGWVGLGALVEGDQIVRHSVEVERDTVEHPDDVEVPTPIGEVFSSLSQSVEVGSVSVPTAAEDFHGDGGHGDVDVVLADSLLWNWRQSATFEELGERQLFVGGVGEVDLVGPGTLFEGVEVMDHATHGSVGVRGELEPVLTGGSGVALGRLLGCGLDDAEALHPLGDFGLVGAEHRANLGLSVTGLVEGGGVEVVRRGGVVGDVPIAAEYGGVSGAPGDALVAQVLVDPSHADADGGRQLLNRLAGEVSLCEVVHVDVSDFSGHVYNLESGEGWYTADSFIVHNCKHVESAFVPDVTRPGGTEPNPEGYEATQQQRYYERKIREWKRRAAVAEGEQADYATAKVREWQARTREHVRVHGLDRRYYRETPRVGAA